MNYYNEEFWTALEALVKASEKVIDRPKGSRHPRYPEILYKVDYGYLKATTSMDGGGIDIWVGTDQSKGIDAIICTIDLSKKDSEIKILINCSDDEKAIVYDFYNSSEYMKGILIPRTL